MRLEKAINPLLDDNDLVALNFIFKNVVIDRMKTVENASSHKIEFYTKVHFLNFSQQRYRITQAHLTKMK